MTYVEALKLAKQKESLVNQLTSHNAILNEVIIAPTNREEFEKFRAIYCQTLNAQESIMPFILSDLMVLGVFDKHRIKSEGILLIDQI